MTNLVYSYSLDGAFPCCQSRPEAQTKASLLVRITCIAIGSLAIMGGAVILILVHAKISVFIDISSKWSWMLLSGGLLLTVPAIFMRCVKYQIQTVTTNWEGIIVDPHQIATSWLPKLQASQIHSNYGRIYICPLWSHSSHCFFTAEGLMKDCTDEIHKDSDTTKMLLIICPQDEGAKAKCQIYPRLMLTAREDPETMQKLDVAFLFSGGITWFGAINAELTELLEGEKVFARKGKITPNSLDSESFSEAEGEGNEREETLDVVSVGESDK